MPALPGRPLRPHRALRALLLGAVGALVLAAGAAAHPALTPSAVETGAVTRVVAEIPNERAGRSTVALTLVLPAGFTIEGAEPVGDWQPKIDGRSATWEGGTLTGETSAAFALTVRAVAPTATYAVALRQRYDDGRTVRTTAPIAVLPSLGDAAPDQHVGRAIAAAVTGVVVVIVALLGLRLLRRRRPG